MSSWLDLEIYQPNWPSLSSITELHLLSWLDLEIYQINKTNDRHSHPSVKGIHLPSWLDLYSEMIEGSIKRKKEKKVATEDNYSSSYPDTMRNSVGNAGEDNELHSPRLEVDKKILLDELFDELAATVSIEKNKLKLLEIQTARHTPLQILVPRFNNLRRHELIHIVTAIQTALHKHPGIEDNISDIRSWLKRHSTNENTRPEIEYIQTSVGEMLKNFISKVSNRQNETLDIKTVLKDDLAIGIKPELERLVARRKLLDTMLDRYKICVAMQQNIRYIYDAIDLMLERINTGSDLQIKIRYIYDVIDPVIEQINTVVDVEQEMCDIKDAISAMLEKNNPVIDVQRNIKAARNKMLKTIITIINARQELEDIFNCDVLWLPGGERQRVRHMYNEKDAMLEINEIMFGVKQEEQYIHDAIDALLGKINPSWVDTGQRRRLVYYTMARQEIRHICYAIDLMCAKNDIGVEAQQEKQDIIDTVRAML